MAVDDGVLTKLDQVLVAPIEKYFDSLMTLVGVYQLVRKEKIDKEIVPEILSKSKQIAVSGIEPDIRSYFRRQVGVTAVDIIKEIGEKGHAAEAAETLLEVLETKTAAPVDIGAVEYISYAADGLNGIFNTRAGVYNENKGERMLIALCSYNTGADLGVATAIRGVKIKTLKTFAGLANK